MKTKKAQIIDVIKNSGINLLIIVTTIILITSILFLFHIEITKWHLPVLYLLGNILFFILFRKTSYLKHIFISSLLSIIVFTSSIAFVTSFYDLTVDGNTYHKLAIGSLKNGWNPIYEDNEDFTQEKGNKFDVIDFNLVEYEETKVGTKNVIWTNHYPKGNWTFSAVIYAFTGNIESGKALTVLFMYIGFAIVFGYLSKKINWMIACVVSLLLVINPITVVQACNYYIDGLLGILIALLLVALLSITDKYKEKKILQKEELLILACTIMILSNIKFTGLVYAGFFCFAFYLYWLYKSKKEGVNQLKGDALFYTIFYGIIVVISICIIGFSSYVRNTLEHKNPFYPLYGEGKQDIITQMQPNYFAQRNSIEKFLISIFSRGENVTYHYDREDIKPTLKFPFTYTKQELENYNMPDIRIGGFGPLFSGILIISTVITICAIYDLWRKKKFDYLIPYLLILLIIAISILAIDGSWWARYIPFLYIVPILSILYLWKKDKSNGIKIALGTILTLLMILNTSMLINTTMKNYEINGGYIEKVFEDFERYSKSQEMTTIKLKGLGYQGALYNVYDKKINIKVDNNMEANRDGYFFMY